VPPPRLEVMPTSEELLLAHHTKQENWPPHCGAEALEAAQVYSKESMVVYKDN